MPAQLTWDVPTFLRAWNYTEKFSPRTNPFFGVAFAPWDVVANFDASANVLTVGIFINNQFLKNLKQLNNNNNNNNNSQKSLFLHLAVCC
jgi:hypothetical protein